VFAHDARMFELAPRLVAALGAANQQLGRDALEAARAQTNLGGRNSDRTMASLAKAAVFTEAVLSAMHARLQEIKSVTK